MHIDRSYEVAIVGGGVIGLCLARELVQVGVSRVVVVDRGRTGREASWAAAGMLAPSAENEVIDDLYRLCDESRSMFPTLADELAIETGIDIELDRSGTLFTAFTDADREHLSSRYHKQLAAGIPVERLSAKETLSAEPNLAPDLRESLYFPHDWQVENRKLVTALRASVEMRGVDIVENAAVESVSTEYGKTTGVTVKGRSISARTVILATGAWTSAIQIEGSAIPVEVRPVRGQMLSFERPQRSFTRVIYSPRGYLVPRADGRILAGATVEEVGFDPSTTDDGAALLKAAAAEIAPELSAALITDHWAGLRPCSVDGLPIIGQMPGIAGLFVATAHYRNGILLAPITARIIAERIVEGTSSHYLDLFGPGRWSGRGFNANA